MFDDVYTLSPMQSGLLFHALAHPHSRAFLEQGSAILDGPLNTDLFADAWRAAIERHTALRTSFRWQGLSKPLQTVCARVPLPLSVDNWTHIPTGEREVALANLLAADRAAGMDLTTAPLMRLKLLRLAEHRHWFLWTIHHLVHDSWSTSLLLQEVLEWHAARETRRALPSCSTRSARPYRDFIRWIRAQDRTRAEEYWRTKLTGFRQPTPLLAEGTSSPEATRRVDLHLDVETTAAIETTAKRLHLTQFTMLQGAFSLVAAIRTGLRDVLFGCVTSGRPAALPGVERMVGVFINTLPVRVQIDEECLIADWLLSIQQDQQIARDFDYIALSDVQSWSAIPRGTRLFQAVLVFQNSYTSPPDAAGLRISDVRFHGYPPDPIMLRVWPGSRMWIELHYDPEWLNAAQTSRLLNDVCGMLTQIAAHPAACVRDLIREAPIAPGRRAGMRNRLQQAAAGRNVLCAE
jgi:Condensation domain